MGPVRRLFRLGLGRPGVREAVDWELQHYLEEQTDRLVKQGMDPASARVEAERRLGGLARQSRRIVSIDRRRVVMRKRWMIWDAVVSTFRYAMRGVRRSPGFSLAVVLTLGLGIGVNAAMFGIVDRLLLRPPDHVAEPDQVRRVLREGRFFGEHDVLPISTYPDLEDLRTVPEFSSVGGVSSVHRVTLGTGEEARQVRVLLATYDFFRTLGVRAQKGRFFTVDDDQVDAPATAVVSQEFWESSLGSDPNVLGRTLRLAGHPVTVVGVAPRGFTGVDLTPVDVWLPAVMGEALLTGGDRFLTSRTYWWFRSVVRLGEGQSLENGEAKATALHVNSRADLVAQGRFDGDARIITAPIIKAWGPEATSESKVARWLAGVSFIVLLIACANVANLLLARGAGRRHEVAVRLSLGVSRGRLIRDMASEALVLAAVGGVLALAVAQWGGGLIRSVLIPDVLWTTSALTLRVAAVTAALSVAAGLLSGVGPALQSSQVDLTRDLSEGGRGASGSRAGVRRALTVAQAALSTVLLVGAGLFVHSLIEVHHLDLGVDVGHLIQAQLEFQGEEPDYVEQTALYDEAMKAVAQVPGVAAVTGTDILHQWASIADLSVPGLDSLPVPPRSGPFIYGVTPGYMVTMGLDLLEGRPIRESDDEGGPRVAVVNELMARTLWPGRSALGQCFFIEEGVEEGEEPECTTVVGIMENAWRGELDGPAPLMYLVPLAQVREAPQGLFIRTEGSPRDIAARVAPVLRSFSPRVRFAEVQTMRELMGRQTRSWTLGATLFSAFGFLALLVAGIGLYSVLAFDVARRTREFGIRAALGAARTRVLRSVVSVGLALVSVGVALGAGIAVVASPYAENLLFHVEGRDPVVLVTVAAVLLAVAMLASIVPGMRATRVNPVEALRAE